MVTDEQGEVMQWPNVPWSYSAISKFEQCELSYGAVNVQKKWRTEETEAMSSGTLVHRQMEDYVAAKKELPLMLQPLGRAVDRLCQGAKAVYPERSVNLTYRLDPCGVFHDDCCWRGRIDLTVMRADATIIVDYKTGREPRDTFDQLELCAFAAMVERPEIEVVHAMYAYTKHGLRQMPTFTRADLPRVVREWTPRLKRLQIARAEAQYRATPGPWCRWCPVLDCQFNPKGNGR